MNAILFGIMVALAVISGLTSIAGLHNKRGRNAMISASFCAICTGIAAGMVY